MLIKTKVILEKAKKGGYAVGAFDVYNLEVALGVARAAKEMKSPVIMLVSETTIKYVGLKVITQLVTAIARYEATEVPVALHLDHGKSFRAVAECVNAGFSSIHIDASELPFEENVVVTKQAVDYAHKHNIWAQGELGLIRGKHIVAEKFEGKIPKTNPKLVPKYVKETNVDMLAVAIGPTHGIYGIEHIDFPLLKKIREKTSKVLVLHGGSGVPDREIRKAVKEGISKVNIGTVIRQNFSNTLRKTLRQMPASEIGVRKILAPSIEAVKKVVKEKIKVLGSAGKA